VCGDRANPLLQGPLVEIAKRGQPRCRLRDRGLGERVEMFAHKLLLLVKRCAHGMVGDTGPPWHDACDEPGRTWRLGAYVLVIFLI